jgi:hypothetical protein
VKRQTSKTGQSPHVDISKTTKTWSSARLRPSAVMQFAAIYSSNGADLHLQTDVLREAERRNPSLKRVSTPVAQPLPLRKLLRQLPLAAVEYWRRRGRLVACSSASRLAVHGCSSVVPASPSTPAALPFPPRLPCTLFQRRRLLLPKVGSASRLTGETDADADREGRPDEASQDSGPGRSPRRSRNFVAALRPRSCCRRRLARPRGNLKAGGA